MSSDAYIRAYTILMSEHCLQNNIFINRIIYA